MNPLPGACQAALALEAVTPCVLIDGALQRALGARLAQAPATAISLFDDLPVGAQALGPWLLPMPLALAEGVDGSGPGVNWLASYLPMQQCAQHLRCWMRDGDPHGVRYTRLADGRVLRAAMVTWTPAQRATFCTPLRGWWLADRDGKPIALDLPAAHSTQPTAAPGWSDAQRQALEQHGTVDQLLQPLKGRVRNATSLRSREVRHAVATQMQQLAAAQGYVDAADQVSWIAWVLAVGQCPASIEDHPVHQRGLRGDDLWSALTDTVSRQLDTSADMEQR